MAKNFHLNLQATNFGMAIERINEMLTLRRAPLCVPEGSSEYFDYPCKRRKTMCTIFFGYTSNMISSGLREVGGFSDFLGLLRSKVSGWATSTSCFLADNSLSCRTQYD
jgi:deoxyhypusine synthase